MRGDRVLPDFFGAPLMPAMHSSMMPLYLDHTIKGGGRAWPSIQSCQSVQSVQPVQFPPLSSMPRLSRGPASPSSPSSPSHMYYNRGRLLSRKQPSVVVSGIGVPGLFRCGDVGKQLIQRALKGQQLLLDILQLLDGDKPLVHAISIVAYLCLGGIQF